MDALHLAEEKLGGFLCCLRAIDETPPEWQAGIFCLVFFFYNLEMWGSKREVM